VAQHSNRETALKSLRLFGFLLSNARGTVIVMTLAGTLSGLCSAGVIALISRTLAHHSEPIYLLALGFAALAAGKIISTALAQLLLVRFSQRAILDLSLDICEKLVRAPLRNLEQRGTASIHATLTDDVSSIIWAVQCIPQLAMNVAVLIGCAAYLCWLSWQMFLTTACVCALGAAVYALLHARAFQRIHAARSARTKLFGHFRTLTGGLKELMMHRARREDFIRVEMRAAAEECRGANQAAAAHYSLAEGWVQGVFYALLGLLLFASAWIGHQSQAAITGYAFAMLYATSPLWSVIGALPAVSRGEVALEQLQQLGLLVREDSGPEASAPPRAAPVLDIRGAVFSYEDGQDHERGFTLGPLDFSIQPGELVFVVGGNGSGKSTFVKLLAGLYPPREGAIEIDGLPVTAANRVWYREHFSVVFADFHLFEGLLGLRSPALDSASKHYLSLLQIDHKVSVSDGRLSTTSLSQGQRRRLALVTAYLEDRPCYVFDEWAADQDPDYKEIFYRRLLPELRARGKSVVVITHDDRYFHLGSRVVKLENGRIVDNASQSGTQGSHARIAGGTA